MIIFKYFVESVVILELKCLHIALDISQVDNLFRAKQWFITKFPDLGNKEMWIEEDSESESVRLQWNWASVNWKCCKERKSEIVILQLNFAEWNVGWCFVCAAPPFLITFPTTACTFEVRIAGDDNASRGLFHKRERALFQGFQQG